MQRLKAHIGVTIDRKWAHINASGVHNSQHIYGLANLHYELGDNAKISVSNTDFLSKHERLKVGVGVGVSHDWDNGRYSLYGEALTNSSVKHFAENYAVQGNIGLRIKW